MEYKERIQIFTLIPKIMGEVGAIGKTRDNKDQGYKFRGVDEFLNELHPIMAKHGVFDVTEVLERQSEDRVSRSGSTMIRVSMRVRHRFFAPDASYVDVVTWGEGIDSSDKATNKAMTASAKYALIYLFMVPTRDMDDGDAVTPEAGAKQTEQPVPVSAITPKQAGLLHSRFRESLPEENRQSADDILHDWLETNGILDEHGKPTALAIRKADFERVGREAIAYAKSLTAEVKQ